jgi:hypothetical protein
MRSKIALAIQSERTEAESLRGQLAEAELESGITELKAKLAQEQNKVRIALVALIHCRNRPHEHNPSKGFTMTQCEVIDRAIKTLSDEERN